MNAERSTRPSVLVFDASVLEQHNWPHASGRLEQLLDTAPMCAIPEVVLWELEAIWQRKRQKLLERIRDETRQVGIEATIKGTETEHVQSYNQAVADLFGRFRLSKLPLTSRTLEALVIASARHELPFTGADSGFRDALVILSIADVSAHLKPRKSGQSSNLAII